MSLSWSGLEQFKADLRNLPEHLADEAGTVVVAHAQEAERLVETAYPTGPTGNLRAGVKLTTQQNRFGAAGVVRSTAPHSHLFERGTRKRQTGRGANRGTMPQAPQSQQMIPIIVQVRRRMVAALITVVQKAGFTVTTS